jgi:hypothetical protein
MWQAIGYVTSGFTLCAFVVAAIVLVIKARLTHRRELIETASEEQRADLVARTLEFFAVDTGGLSRKQQHDIAIIQIDHRMERFRIAAWVVVILAVLGALVSGFAITRMVGVSPDPQPGAMADKGAGDTLTQYEPFGELRPDEYNDNDGSPESEEKAKAKVVQRLSHYSDKALEKDADAFCRNLYNLASNWNQEEKAAGDDFGKGIAIDARNMLDYSRHSWPEVAALRTVFVPKILAKRVEQINVDHSAGASLADKPQLIKARDVELVRQYLSALKDSFVASREGK